MAKYQPVQLDITDVKAVCAYIEREVATWSAEQLQALSSEVLALTDKGRSVAVEVTPVGFAAITTPELFAVLRRHGLSGPAIPVQG
jgi:hypothetical protein